MIVSPVAYYPGTAIYNEAKAAGKVSDRVWEVRDDAGLYVLDRSRFQPWVNRLLLESRAAARQAPTRPRILPTTARRWARTTG